MACLSNRRIIIDAHNYTNVEDAIDSAYLKEQDYYLEENLVEYCKFCRRIGHDYSDCMSKNNYYYIIVKIKGIISIDRDHKITIILILIDKQILTKIIVETKIRNNIHIFNHPLSINKFLYTIPKQIWIWVC